MSNWYEVRYLRLGDSRVSHESVWAESPRALQDALAARGYTVLSTRVSRRDFNVTARRKRLSRNRFALFCREVGTLIEAGMTVVEAVDTLSARERLAGRGEGLADELLVQLEQGISLSNALARLYGAPTVLVAAVRAGERTSDLPRALADYLQFDALVEKLRSKVISAAIYPALVSLLGVGISVFLLLVVMPSFARMYTSLRGSASGATYAMIVFAEWVSHHQLIMLLVVVGVLLLVGGWLGSGMARKHVLASAMQLAWARSKMIDFRLAMMFQALALMLKGGYPMTEALNVASRSALDVQLSDGLRDAIDRIEEGAPVAQTLHSAGLCDEVDRRLLAAAERNGSFHHAASVVSRLHGERFELFVERVTRIVEPVLLMAVALMVGGIVVMMYLPVFDMATRLR